MAAPLLVTVKTFSAELFLDVFSAMSQLSLRTFLARQHSSRSLLDMMQCLCLPFRQVVLRGQDPRRFECNCTKELLKDEIA